MEQADCPYSINEKMWIEYASIFSTNSQIKQFATQKHAFEVQQTVFEKLADLLC